MDAGAKNISICLAYSLNNIQQSHFALAKWLWFGIDLISEVGPLVQLGGQQLVELEDLQQRYLLQYLSLDLVFEA